MPHTPAALIVVAKTTGGNTGAMARVQAESYLENVLADKGRESNLKQSLNDVTGGKGKATGRYLHGGLPVLHASSGNGAKSATLFYTLTGATATIFAMGEHGVGTPTQTKYIVSEFGPLAGEFSKGKTITI